MDNIENNVHGLPWYMVVVLNLGVLIFHKFGYYFEDIMGVYYGIANFILTTGAIIVLGFKLYEYYKKHIKQ